MARECLAIGVRYRPADSFDILVANAIGAEKPQCLEDELNDVVPDAEAAHRSVREANLEITNVDRPAWASRQIFQPRRDLGRQMQRVERERTAGEDGQAGSALDRGDDISWG